MKLRIADILDRGDPDPMLWIVDLGYDVGLFECNAAFAADAVIEGFPVWLECADVAPSWRS